MIAWRYPSDRRNYDGDILYLMDIDTGEVLVECDLPPDFDGSTPRWRGEFSRAWREAGEPEIGPDVATQLGLPPGFVPVPSRGPLGPLAHQAMCGAVQSSGLVRRTSQIEDRSGLLSFGSQIDGNGERDRFNMISPRVHARRSTTLLVGSTKNVRNGTAKL